MLEVELKFPVPQPDRLRAQLQQLGFTRHATHEELDRYYNAPDRDFQQTDEALRIRRMGHQVQLTYKGAKQGAVGKIRKEVQLALEAGTADTMHQLLLALRYQPSIEVKKQRTIYKHPSQKAIQITWDEVDQLGTFIELELQVPEGDQAAALQVLQSVAERLQLGKEERRSYLELKMLQGAPASATPLH